MRVTKADFTSAREKVLYRKDENTVSLPRLVLASCYPLSLSCILTTLACWPVFVNIQQGLASLSLCIYHEFAASRRTIIVYTGRLCLPPPPRPVATDRRTSFHCCHDSSSLYLNSSFLSLTTGFIESAKCSALIPGRKVRLRCEGTCACTRSCADRPGL
jgi:hypothetical protein